MLSQRVAAAALASLVLAVVPACSDPAEEVPDAVGPADEYLEQVFDYAEDRHSETDLWYQEVLAGCMAEQGFEYLPFTVGMAHIDPADLDIDIDSREFAEQFGYGALPGSPLLATASRADHLANPNDQITANMSPNEFAEYQEAFWGGFREADADAAYDEAWPGWGCTGLAWHEVFGSGVLTSDVYQDLDAEITRIDTHALPANPRVIEADGAWSQCMADEGYPGYARQDDAALDARQRWMELQDILTEEYGNAIPGGPDDLAPGEAELIEDEIALAVTDWDCRHSTDYDAAVAAVRNELQQQYVDAHRAELDAWVAQWAAQ